MMRSIGRRGFAGLAAGGVMTPYLVRAQDAPSKQVRIVVPYPAGGATDIVARLIAPRLGERWKQTVIIDNKPGASGILGSEIVARSAGDGATLLMTTAAHTINPFFAKSLPYDTLRDFKPITMVVAVANTLVGSVKAGFDNAESFLAAARSTPGKYQFGSTENTSRIVGELFRVRSGLAIDNVAYKGSVPMLQDLAAGHIPVGFTSPPSVLAHHRAGTIRMLAIGGTKRLTALPDVPTMEEAGVSGMDQSSWLSLFGPASLPPSMATRIRADVVDVLAEAPVLARIHDLASEPGGEPPEAFAQRIRTELALWQEIARIAGIVPE